MNNEDQVQETQVEDLEVTAEESQDVKGGAGKVTMQDFHFVMRSNKASATL